MKYVAVSLAALAMLAPVAPVSADDGPKTVNARNAQRAAAMEVDDPNTLICIRVPITGSRTRTRKDCRTSAGWKSHMQEVAATQRGMNESQ